MNTEKSEQEGLRINQESLHFLHEIAKWSGILAIAGFVGLAFLLLLGVISGIFLTYSSDVATGIFVIGFYSLFVLIYILPVVYLYQFSKRLKIALRLSDPDSLTTALANLKKHYKFLGIATLIIVSLYFIIMVVAAITSLSPFLE